MSELKNRRTAKTCPNCGPAVRLVIREQRDTGHLFLGCSRWPDCDFTEPLPESLKMRAMGQPELPLDGIEPLVEGRR